MRSKIRLLALLSVMLLLSSCFGFDPVVGVTRKGVMAKGWDVECFRKAMTTIGIVSIDKRKSTDPNLLYNTKLINYTSFHVDFFNTDDVAIGFWPLANGGYGYKQSWNTMGYKLQKSRVDDAIARFDKQTAVLSRVCGVEFYPIETMANGKITNDE